MAENKIIGYKKLFGFVLPDWVDEKIIKYSASGLVSAAVIFLVLIFVIWPNLETADTKSKLLVSERSALASLKKSQEGINSAQNILGTKEMDLILASIPQQYSPEAAVYMLRQISNDSGVSITSYSLPAGTLLDTSPVVDKAARLNADMVEFTTFPIKITVAAPVESLLKFVAKIESSLPFGVVSDLNLQEVTKLAKSSTAKESVQLVLGITFFQSNLRSVNINKVQPFTEEDIALAKELTKYNLLNGSITGSTNTIDTTVPGTNNVFGF